MKRKKPYFIDIYFGEYKLIEIQIDKNWTKILNYKNDSIIKSYVLLVNVF